MRILKDEIDSLIKSEGYSFVKIFDDEYVNKYANYCKFLERNQNHILTNYNNITLDDILYSAYYWYTALRRQYIDVYGEDSSIDQEHFKTLERIETLEKEYNWDVIMEINKEFNFFD